MVSSNIYFNRDGITRLDIGTVTSIQYAKVTFSISGIDIHSTNNLSKGQNYYDWDISEDEKALIMSLLPKTSKSVTGTMKVDITWSPTGWDAPLFSKEYNISFILEETQETKPALALKSKLSTKFDDFVQGKTKLLFTVKAEAKNGASLINPTATVNGKSCSVRNSDGNGNYTLQSGWLISSGTNRISVTIKDSRGFSQTITDEIYVHPYIPPSLSSLASEMGVTCRRWNTTANIVDDTYGTACRVAVGIGLTYIPGIQTGYNLTYRYRVRGASEWSEYFLVKGSNQEDISETGVHSFIGYITETPFSTEYEYDIELIVTDDLGEKSSARYEQLRSISTSFNINDNGDVVAVGKYASNTKHRVFDSAWDIYSDETIEAVKDVKVGKALHIGGTIVTATAKELNCTTGATANLQAQINGLREEIFSLVDALATYKTEVNGELESIRGTLTDVESTAEDAYSKVFDDGSVFNVTLPYVLDKLNNHISNKNAHK